MNQKEILWHDKMSFDTLYCMDNTSIFQGIPIFLRENKLVSLGKMKIIWKNNVLKLALIMT